MEEKIVAYVIMIVEVGKEYEVLEEVKKFSEVTEARVVYGEFDLVVRLEVNSIKDLERVVMGLRRIKGVLRTATLISAT